MPSRPSQEQVPRPSHNRRRYWWLAGLAALYSGLIYVNALDNPYTYDDVRTVQGNRSLDDLRAFKRIVLRESMRPLVNVSYALDRAIWPWQLVGHHLSSVLLHVLNVLLVFQLAWVAVRDQRSHAPPGIDERASPEVVAFLAASLFGLHPLMTEAVGYISGRSEVLYTCFFLLALLSARRWMIGEGVKWIVLATGLWAAALMSKEVAVFWPLIASMYDHLVLGSPEADWRRRFRLVYMPMLAVTVAIGVIRVGILVLVENPGESHLMWQFIPVEMVVCFKYFQLALVPAGQTIFHQIEPIRSPFDPTFLMAVAWLAVWLGLAWRLRRHNGLVALGMIWFVLLFVPSSLLVLLDLGEPMAEHRAYLSTAGLFLAVGAGFGWAWAFFNTRTAQSRLLVRCLIAMWLTVLGAMTVLRNEIWGSPVRLWLEAVDRSPDIWVPHLLLGEALHERGAAEQALGEYRMAMRLRPEEPTTYMKVGLTLAELHRLDEAADIFRQLEERTGGSALARNGLGAVALLAGRTDEAKAHYRSALTVDSKDVASRQSLALIAETVDHDPAAALMWCQQIQRVVPETPGNDDCIRRNQAALAGAGPPR
jgi:protein O-mannosyl-transferase